MKTIKMIFYLSVLLALVIITVNSCKKNNTSETAGQSTMDLRMTDATGIYDKVVVNIQEVWVNVEGKGWSNVSMTRPGEYDLLEFNNGNDTLIARGSFPSGKVIQIRLVLGAGNYIVAGGVKYNMATPSAEESGLKINFSQHCESGKNYIFWLDFDAGHSIVIVGNGNYQLKPVIRGFIVSNTGAVSGDVVPAVAANQVYAVLNLNTNDTFATYIRTDGYFKICGLEAGVYSLTFTLDGNVVKTMNPVSISANSVNNLGTINIP